MKMKSLEEYGGTQKTQKSTNKNIILKRAGMNIKSLEKQG
jgi:hypothetical protein